MSDGEATGGIVNRSPLPAVDEDRIRKIVRETVEKVLREKEKRVIHQSEIPPGTIKRRHLADKVVVFGVDADLPASDSTGISVFFATDTDKLYLYNGTSWVSEVLT